jgi:hypothetical protein
VVIILEKQLWNDGDDDDDDDDDNIVVLYETTMNE